MASTTGITPPSHTEALNKLCRFCCELLPKEQKNVFKVAGYQNMLKSALIETDADKSNIHPANFCLRCYASIKNIIGRSTTTTHLDKFTWVAHTESCSTCCNFQKLKKGGRKSKKRQPGRAANHEKLWNRDSINEIVSSCCQSEQNLSKVTWDEINNKYNPQINLCLCSSCNKVMQRPIIITPCEHAFCLAHNTAIQNNIITK